MIIGNIVCWLAAGLLVGFIGSKVVNLRGDDPRLGLAAACGGAIVVAALYTLISGGEMTTWNVWALLFAAIGSAAAVMIWHGVRSRYVSRASYTTRRSY